MERVEVINEYYANLDYYNNKNMAFDRIYKLSKTVRFHEKVHYSTRMEEMANIIKENISIFKSISKHVDIIDTIVQYLTIYATKMKRDKDVTFQTAFNVLLTFFNICKEFAIRSFLLYPMYANSSFATIESVHAKIKSWLSLIGLGKEMIILEDSDLYAAVNFLKLTDNYSLNKIWVQDQVKEKFLWIMKRHSVLFTIDTFQSLKDIQPHVCDNPTISIVSIWSEDIVTARNLASSLNSHIVFINTYMDFSDNCILLPYMEIIEQARTQRTLREIREKKSDLIDTEQSVNVIHFSHIAKMNYTSVYNLFYNGTWQKPVEGMYWKHNDNLWANATNGDIIRCYESAEKGFITWGVMSVETRIQMLAKLESKLKLNGKIVLAAIAARWLKFPYLFPTVQGSLSENGTVEVWEICKPVGVIILREEKESVLFFRLMQTLIAGNSVIVMFDANFCNLTPYCDMFSKCGIPPGVINMLSHENTNMLEYKLCSARYTDYAGRIFSKGDSRETYIIPYVNLTVFQKIVLRLK
ncbi:PREDICTED: uncharacterized protein LOC105560987 [Vollenhovia emeryi]|uniref:uncharacterized protein LOC105560987 n=1 Tax=Vollenhovia emeryi TaxID=411798 RepID=UPI0005F4001A|nr:PREDICTED: uncharacterized protein LOC105560987 [Vollenhovia emeryi]